MLGAVRIDVHRVLRVAYCGGYAPKGFAGYGEYRGSIAAFLFTWPTAEAAAPIKLQKIGGAGLRWRRSTSRRRGRASAPTG
mmetsp:Transcript_15286/g.36655  ORF Transcript_15286/g.36655 Transcript_15286/m.36655 type:complete len:81 (-) Transcript_15286:619-861(-)